MEAFGAVDELNSVLGLLLTHGLSADVAAGLTGIQHDLFDLGGELSIPGHRLLEQSRVDHLERWLDRLNEELEPLKEFILPGGTAAAAVCHLARTVCRRAERCVVSLAREESINDTGLRYLNRLSDLLFVLARSLNHAAGTGDVLWRRDRRE